MNEVMEQLTIHFIWRVGILMLIWERLGDTMFACFEDKGIVHAGSREDRSWQPRVT
jgi:hypothetical protein